MKKRLLNLLIPLLATTSALAGDELHSLIISFHDGNSVAVVLADKPRAAIQGDSLLVESQNFCATYLRDDIAGFHFGWETPTGIEAMPENEVQIMYVDNNTVQVRGIDSDASIGVYTLDGRLVAPQLNTMTDGVAVSLHACPSGVYLIRINNKQTYKIIKR